MMALRLRKNVQKAAYYVWFLGAREAKGLRGSRILLPVIPRLVEKSIEHEPLKVTLQVSHKGLKIIQNSAKHFIPHGAITCSVQTEDIVACVLMLYNPTTKCPLHIHAYRCDSETTAQALNHQLQILINRPENQKRFAELETRLSLPAQLAAPVESAPLERKHQITKQFDSPRRFESSHGSDTDTSTRESECSEEQQHLTNSSVLPISYQSKLYDSLAAELREKLNGGVPLLLPAKDSDKPNTSDFRRYRNPHVVGSLISVGNNQGVSSLGSSGIGSDLAPSPERQDIQCSSEEEWVSEADVLPSTSHQHDPQSKTMDRYVENRLHRIGTYREPTTSYLYPNVQQGYGGRFQRLANCEEDQSLRESINSREEKVKPIITKPVPIQSRFDEFEKNDIIDDDCKKQNVIELKRHNREDIYRRHGHTIYFQKHVQDNNSENYKQSSTGKYYDSYNNRENLTDRQKYHEIISVSTKYQDQTSKRVDYWNEYVDNSPEKKYRGKHPSGYEDQHDFKVEHEISEIEFSDRRPQLADPLMFRNVIDKECMSPLSNYKSSDDSKYNRGRYDNKRQPAAIYTTEDAAHITNREKSSRHRNECRKPTAINSSEVRTKTANIKTSSPESTIRKVSPKDRFQTAKEKFQQMDRERHEQERLEKERHASEQTIHAKPTIEVDRVPGERSSIEPVIISSHEFMYHWSPEDEGVQRRGPLRSSNISAYHEIDANELYSGLDGDHEPTQSRLMPAENLGNLAKGFRHSYAEQRPPHVSRSSGRVGLAAVNPY